MEDIRVRKCQDVGAIRVGSLERWVTQGLRHLLGIRSWCQVRLPGWCQKGREVSVQATPQLPQGVLTLLSFASLLGALHPSGGGDGWDGVGNQHE